MSRVNSYRQKMTSHCIDYVRDHLASPCRGKRRGRDWHFELATLVIIISFDSYIVYDDPGETRAMKEVIWHHDYYLGNQD